jgi:orotidine-5'-phosphate decarboxylase
MELLHSKWDQNKFVCLGLDSEFERIPTKIKFHEPGLSINVFNKEIVQVTADIVCAYKPNLAFYLAQGSEGLLALKMTMDWLRTLAPDVPVILDAKFADIGNTNRGYAAFAFDYLGADAVTLQPYLGNLDPNSANTAGDFAPFLEHADRGCIFICRTSNKGAKEFQDLLINMNDREREIYGVDSDALPLYMMVAGRAAQYWNNNGNVCLVTGATYPKELNRVRSAVGAMPLLIPGIGKQGGDLEATIRAGVDSVGQGMIINSSRGIIFASDGIDFAERAREETLKLHNDINRVLRMIS